MPQRLWSWAWIPIVLALLALRIPAWAAPVGSDQSLYLYVADTLREGRVPYVDAWDQKPPAVFAVYALLRSAWSSPSVVAFADLAAACALAWALIALGRQTVGGLVGWHAASIALLFGHPSISRLSGVYVRGQCEAFIAPAVAIALVLLTRPARRTGHVVLAGVLLGIAFWLKYNALAYVIPAMLAVRFWPNAPEDQPGRWRADLVTALIGFLIPGAVVLLYFAVHGALVDLWLATIVYNIQYSGETYTAGPAGAFMYVLSLPLTHARVDFLWFLGGLGAMGMLLRGVPGERRIAALALSWPAAAVISIAINGARDLPQYFVQAVPAMAFLAAAGLTVACRTNLRWAAGAAALILVGLWRVGVESPFYGLRWGGVPQLAENVRFDSAYLAGRLDTRTYLARYKGVQKYDALATHDLSELVVATTPPDEPILVFGFSPGVYIQSGRKSSSRFFWSRPVIVGFAADRPGFGPAGLLTDLAANPPALVALQKRDWADDEQSAAFFLRTPSLREWLVAAYTQAADTPEFSVWIRNR
jgi:hypothetical protein